MQEVLTGVMGISRRMIQRLTRTRGVLLNRRPAFLGRSLREGDILAVRVTDRATGKDLPAPPPPAIGALQILHEDDDFLVIDKPPGVVVHPTSSRDRATLAHAVAHHLRSGGSAGIAHPVHRLDRDTTGAIVFARSSFAHQHLDRQLRRGELEREYLALVEGEMDAPAGTIEAPIGKVAGKPWLRRVSEEGRPARTHYRVVATASAASLVRLRLDTGRTHQIRVHLAHIGHPVLGDRAYGARRSDLIGRVALHSSRIALHQPRTAERIEVVSPLAADMVAVLESLGVSLPG